MKPAGAHQASQTSFSGSEQRSDLRSAQACPAIARDRLAPLGADETADFFANLQAASETRARDFLACRAQVPSEGAPGAAFEGENMHPSRITDAALLLARILLGVFFVMSGYGKITGYSGTMAYMTAHGLPGALLPLVILTELGGGLAVIVGLGTRLAAVALAGFAILSGLLFHDGFSILAGLFTQRDPVDMNQFIHFMKNVTIAGGFLALFGAGAGRFSVDGVRGSTADGASSPHRSLGAGAA
jgi:putative oxidoreductase